MNIKENYYIYQSKQLNKSREENDNRNRTFDIVIRNEYTPTGASQGRRVKIRYTAQEETVPQNTAKRKQPGITKAQLGMRQVNLKYIRYRNTMRVYIYKTPIIKLQNHKLKKWGITVRTSEDAK
jgi:hypothetical protein